MSDEEEQVGEGEAKIIHLFSKRVMKPDKPFSERKDGGVRDLLNDRMAESIADVQTSIEGLWSCETPAELRAEVKRIKAEVRRWPSA